MNSSSNSKSKDKCRNSIFLTGDINNKSHYPRNSLFVPKIEMLTMSPVKLENKKIENPKLKMLDLLNSEFTIIPGAKLPNMNNLVSNDSFYDHMITKYCSPKVQFKHKKNKVACKEQFLLGSLPAIEQSLMITPAIASVSHFETNQNFIDNKVQANETQYTAPSNQIEPLLTSTEFSNEEKILDFKFPSQLSTVIITPRKIGSNSHAVRQSKVKYKNDLLNNALSQKVRNLQMEQSITTKKLNQSEQVEEVKVKTNNILSVTANINTTTNCKSKRVSSTKKKVMNWLCF